MYVNVQLEYSTLFQTLLEWFSCCFSLGAKHISKEKMAEIQSKIAADRRKLEEQKDMAEEERNKVQEDLMTKESELKQYQYVL